MNTKATKLWNKDFITFAIGWEFALIGETLLRFALPLYILQQTGDPMLMGTILAFSTIPFIVLSPISGVVADRFNKRKLLGIMNLATALAIMGYIIMSEMMEIVAATIIIMLVLIALESLISPTVESSVPFLVPKGELVRANSITFLMTTFSSVGSPMLGGFILAGFGLVPILFISILLYVLAAIAQYMAKIPFTKLKMKENLVKTVKSDIKDAIYFVTKENKTLGKVILIISLFCIVLAPILTVALPVLVTIIFKGGEMTLGLIQGFVLLGGVVGVISISFLGKNANISKMSSLLWISSIPLLPAAFAFIWSNNSIYTYIILIIALFIIFAIIEIMAIICWSYIGEKSPENLVGKIMALSSALMILGVAIGNYLYGFMFNHFIETPEIALFIIVIASAVVAFVAKIKE